MTDKFIHDTASHDAALSATVTISNASPAVISWTAHPLAVGQAFQLSTTGTLPLPFLPATFYYVISGGFGANSFEAASTPGGAAINSTTAGSGTHTIHGVIADDTELELQRSSQAAIQTERTVWSTVKLYVKSWISNADVGLGNVVNSLQLIAANNLSDTTPATARSNIGAWAKLWKPFLSGTYHWPFGYSLGSSGAVQSINRIYFFPVIFPDDVTISDLFLRISAGAAGNWQGAIYNSNNAANLYRPSTLVAKSAASTSTAGTGVIVASGGLNTNPLLTAGTLYYFAFCSDTVTPTYSTINSNGSPLFELGYLIGSTTLANMYGSGIFSGLTFDQALGTWGDMTGNTFAEISVGQPLIGFKVA